MNTSSRKRDRTLEPLAALLRKRREDIGLSQERLAQVVKIDRPAIGTIERAERDPGFTTVRRLAIGLRMNWREFGEALHELDPLP